MKKILICLLFALTLCCCVFSFSKNANAYTDTTSIELTPSKMREYIENETIFNSDFYLYFQMTREEYIEDLQTTSYYQVSVLVDDVSYHYHFEDSEDFPGEEGTLDLVIDAFTITLDFSSSEPTGSYQRTDTYIYDSSTMPNFSVFVCDVILPNFYGDSSLFKQMYSFYSLSFLTTYFAFYSDELFLQTFEDDDSIDFNDVFGSVLVGELLSYTDLSYINIDHYNFNHILQDYFYLQLNDKYETEVITIDDVSFTDWLVNSVNGFLDFEIFPNFSITNILWLIISISILIIAIKFFVGG